MNEMTLAEKLITVGLCIIGTMATRFLPFLIFSSKKPIPKFVQYLGKALPAAIYAMLVVYCLKNVDLLHGSHGIPEAIALTVTLGMHLWKRNTILSIALGTITYMLLVQFVFI